MTILAIIDCGSCNLHSVDKSCRRVIDDYNLNIDCHISYDPDFVARADHIILPGVGAFGDCMTGLTNRDGLSEAIYASATHKARPLLGICVGMQMLASYGTEHGQCQGLDFIKGKVVAITPANRLKIPHIGWNTLDLRLNHQLFNGIPTGTSGKHAYFVHSFHFQPEDREHILATTDYGGNITAAVAKNNIVGTQFHPEKSQYLGLKLLANFLQWRP